ncbi:hypothetical protein TorRG33x02_143340 [Trema orientale]|uniref:Uncharacterized protein n=1 Tax=Trema orientale TaxID=63057 RepID=A0A2P5EW96_TREOI|nr:hypothetical protein TorRG33x02_143340 [Trema orientale]
MRPVFQKLLDERKLDSLKALADIAFYTIHRGLGQIVLSLVQLGELKDGDGEWKGRLVDGFWKECLFGKKDFSREGIAPKISKCLV